MFLQVSLVGREFAQSLGTRVLLSVLRLVKTLYLVPNDVSLRMCNMYNVHVLFISNFKYCT